MQGKFLRRRSEPAALPLSFEQPELPGHWSARSKFQQSQGRGPLGAASIARPAVRGCICACGVSRSARAQAVIAFVSRSAIASSLSRRGRPPSMLSHSRSNLAISISRRRARQRRRLARHPIARVLADHCRRAGVNPLSGSRVCHPLASSSYRALTMRCGHGLGQALGGGPGLTKLASAVIAPFSAASSSIRLVTWARVTSPSPMPCSGFQYSLSNVSLRQNRAWSCAACRCARFRGRGRRDI